MNLVNADSWSQVECFDDSGKRNLRSLIHFLHYLRIRCFEKAHAMRLARHESSTNVANWLAVGSELVAGFNCCLLRSSQLFHLDAGKITFNHVDWHKNLLLGWQGFQ